MLKNNFIFYFGIFAGSVTIYLLHALLTLQGLYGDGNGYYVYTNTLFFQGNFDFNPIYSYLSNFHGTKYIFSRIFWDTSQNPYLIGTALTWLPSLSFINTVNYIFNLNLNRFDLVYELGPGITGIIFSVLGLWYLEKYLLNFFKPYSARLTIFAVFVSTNVLYYTALEPALSHQPAFFIISFLLYFSHNFKHTAGNIALMGTVMGFLGSVRIADTILLIPIILQSKLKPKDFIILIPCALTGFLPQIINQSNQYGAILTHPYINGGSGTWQPDFVHFIEFLFSPMRGLFLWTPLLMTGLIGIIKLKRWTLFISILLLWAISSSWSAYLSAGFGQRFSYSAIPLLSVGLNYYFDKLNTKTALIIIFICFLWNLMLLKNIYLHKNLFIQSSTFSYKEFATYMTRLN